MTVISRNRYSLGALMLLLAIAAAWFASGNGALQRPARSMLHAAAAAPAASRPTESAPPSPQPLVLIDVSPEDARKLNAAVPFVGGEITAARPFMDKSNGDDLSRAVDCIAAAAYYEAGDDAVGEAAVVQVVLNRLRHPAFPKTVCAVVFQGAERTTGCQFTFTCDGALQRYSPSPAAWARARSVALAALQGKVFKPIGYATHYHTNWVVPYWSGTLDKIAQVETHLFFRWPGYWGKPASFGRQPTQEEPVISLLARISPVHGGGDASPNADPAVTLAALPAVPGSANDPSPASLASNPSVFLAHLPVALAERFPAIALKACAEMRNCRFMVWTERTSVASALPLSDRQLATMSFSYVRDRGIGFERVLWNCDQLGQHDRCMKVQTARNDAIPATTATP